MLKLCKVQFFSCKCFFTRCLVSKAKVATVYLSISDGEGLIC